MSQPTDVAIVGAGPYGLSIAAHLQSAGVEFRIFGSAMDAWRSHMPNDMLLKSDGFASNLYDPGGEYPLSSFCKENQIPYDDERIPVRLETFVRYGLAFKNRFVPGLEEKLVQSLAKNGAHFTLRLDDGEVVQARRVIVAVGIGQFRFLPEALTGLPPEHLTHSYDLHDLAILSSRSVAIIGGGASAIDLAGLMREQEINVRLVCRAEALRFGGPPGVGQRSLWQRTRHPRSGLGPGLRSRLCTDAPLFFRFLPPKVRLEVVRRHLGPAASWHMKSKVLGRLPVMTGQEILGVGVENGQVRMTLCGSNRQRLEVAVDHVVAATGYRVDIRRLKFMDSGLLSEIRCIDNTPVLSTGFESSTRGLFFVGPAAATSFGPLMRFAYGARFASRRLAEILVRQSREKSSSSKYHDGSNPEVRATVP